jgi:hypothetical protein
MSDELLTEQQVEKIANKASETLKMFVATESFKKDFKLRSFFGRHPEIGKMIKCAKCGRRHREFDVESCGTFNLVKEAEGQRAHTSANPFWRSHPGAYVWIRDLKQFVTIHR